MQDDTTQAKVFICVAVIIFVVNLLGIFYGIYADFQYEQTKKIIQEEYNQQYVNEIEEVIANCQKGAKILINSIPWFGMKILVGTLIAFILIIPQKIYDLLEMEFLLYVHPTEPYQWIIELLIGGMLAWNIASAFLEIGDYVSLFNEINEVINNLKFDILFM